MSNEEILTRREKEVVQKKLNNSRLDQQDSNYLSRFVRPKLRKISRMDANYLLSRIQYNPRSMVLERKIRNFVLKNVKNVASIFIYGSAIQTGYAEYKDIDILIITKNKEWNNDWQKEKRLADLERLANLLGLPLDIQMTYKKHFAVCYQINPSWIYQLKDHKIIYGKIKIPKKVELSKMSLRMKLDWSDLDDIEPESDEIYRAIRNTILVRLLINKIVDNGKLKSTLVEEFGERLLNNLKNNSASRLEKKLALQYLKEITEKTTKEIIESKWEKIKL